MLPLLRRSRQKKNFRFPKKCWNSETNLAIFPLRSPQPPCGHRYLEHCCSLGGAWWLGRQRRTCQKTKLSPLPNWWRHPASVYIRHHNQGCDEHVVCISHDGTSILIALHNCNLTFVLLLLPAFCTGNIHALVVSTTLFVIAWTFPTNVVVS